MERRLTLIDGIELTHPSRKTRVHGLLEQMPVEALLTIPFTPLAELAPHEHQLLAGMPEHVSVQSTQRRMLLPQVARHLVEHRALTVHHFVVREREDEVLG